MVPTSLSKTIAIDLQDFQKVFTALDFAWLPQKEDEDGRRSNTLQQKKHIIESKISGKKDQGQSFYANLEKIFPYLQTRLISYT